MRTQCKCGVGVWVRGPQDSGYCNKCEMEREVLAAKARLEPKLYMENFCLMGTPKTLVKGDIANSDGTMEFRVERECQLDEFSHIVFMRAAAYEFLGSVPPEIKLKFYELSIWPVGNPQPQLMLNIH